MLELKILENIKCIALDFGGTLARHSPTPGPIAALEILRHVYGAKLSAEFESTVVNLFAEAKVNYKLSGRPTSWITIIQAAAELLGELLPPLGTYEERLWKDYPDGPITPEVRSVIHELSEAGYILLLACNTRRPTTQRRDTLREAGLAHCFYAEIISSELGVGKPDPAFYRAVLQQAYNAECEPQQILFVGDSLERDVLGPIKFGMQALLIGASSKKEVAAIPTIGLLPKYLKEKS